MKEAVRLFMIILVMEMMVIVTLVIGSLVTLGLLWNSLIYKVEFMGFRRLWMIKLQTIY